MRLEQIAKNVRSVYYDTLAVSAYIGQECTGLSEIGLDDNLHIVQVEYVDMLIKFMIYDSIIKGILVNKNNVIQCDLVSLL